jgi:hypothetical protein
MENLYCSTYKQTTKQAGLSRATLEISSKISSYSPFFELLNHIFDFLF